MSVKRIGCLLLLAALCLAFSGCRVRTTGSAGERSVENADAASTSQPGSGLDDAAEETDSGENDEAEDPTGQTRENPEAERKEYDENAQSEIVPGVERTIYGGGEGDGAYTEGNEEDELAAKLSDTAEKTATQTVSAEQAAQMGVSDDAKEADSAMTYFTVLLADRTGSLFECHRLNVYWETAADHVTIFKDSLEHDLILNAGAYDVSARLLEENLQVDDGWICRKNPGVIVKVVDSGVLGAGVSSTTEAQKVLAAMLARDGWAGIDAVRNGRVLLLSEELLETPYYQTAAMLMIAKAAYPTELADVDIDEALAMLAEEAAGSIPAGIYYFVQGDV